jgi:hypothetical protein
LLSTDSYGSANNRVPDFSQADDTYRASCVGSRSCACRLAVRKTFARLHRLASYSDEAERRANDCAHRFGGARQALRVLVLIEGLQPDQTTARRLTADAAKLQFEL